MKCSNCDGINGVRYSVIYKRHLCTSCWSYIKDRFKSDFANLFGS